MKRLLLILILFLTQIGALKAQFVTLPDQNLINALMNIHPDCFDANEDLDTTCAALKTGSLDISYNNISDLTGIRYFKLISDLNCSNKFIFFKQRQINLFIEFFFENLALFEQ